MSPPPIPVQGRKRSRQACQTCRDLKRRCDGAEPCGTCVRFEYECRYKTMKPRKEARRSPSRQVHHAAHASPDDAALPHPGDLQTRSLEANSSTTFFRDLSKRLDPKRNPRKNTFAWNAFLGSRQAKYGGVALPITDILSQAQMQLVTAAYLEKLDPTYGFIDHADLSRSIEARWSVGVVGPLQDAILCGVAALGCLFSQVEPSQVESNLVESARVLLDRVVLEIPSATAITAMLLRVVYLRLAGTHYPAWMASCAVMHMIDAAGLHFEDSSESHISGLRHDIDIEQRRRIVCVAQHVNIWMCFDMGLTRVALPNLPMTMPAVREGDCTRELMELLPFTTELDPARNPTVSDLEHALFTVLDGVHTLPSSILCQCNLALCLCRRLRFMEVPLVEPVLQQVLVITSKGIQAARDIMVAGAPWHHMAYVPFQIVCVLLAIDTVSSISQLRDAMQCLKDISQVYNTTATQEALKTARSLVLLHQRGKEVFASALSDILKACPADGGDDILTQPTVPQHVLDGLGNLEQDLGSSWSFDIDQFLGSDFFWNAGVNGY